MKDISVDEVLFGKKDAEISRGIKTNVVKVFTKCPICGCKSFVVVGGNINHFFCGTAIKMTTETKDGRMTTTGTMVNKCKYNMFNFFREHNYNPSMHYDSQYLENLDIEITGCCMYHNYDTPIQTESPHIKIYEKDGRLNLNSGNLVGTALIKNDSTEVRKAVEKYVQDYNDIVVDKNIWSWTITDNKGNYIDSLLGFYGNVYEQAKEYMHEYGIYKEDYDKFWKGRVQ